MGVRCLGRKSKAVVDGGDAPAAGRRRGQGDRAGTGGGAGGRYGRLQRVASPLASKYSTCVSVSRSTVTCRTVPSGVSNRSRCPSSVQRAGTSGRTIGTSLRLKSSPRYASVWSSRKLQ